MVLSCHEVLYKPCDSTIQTIAKSNQQKRSHKFDKDLILFKSMAFNITEDHSKASDSDIVASHGLLVPTLYKMGMLEIIIPTTFLKTLTNTMLDR